MSTGVGELRQGGMEELVLLPERLLLLVNMRLGNLVRHVLVCDLGDSGEEEDKGETEDKNANGEVDPLHALEGVHVVLGCGEEDVRGERGGHAGADAVEGLGQVDTDFGILGGPADCK